LISCVPVWHCIDAAPREQIAIELLIAVWINHSPIHEDDLFGFESASALEEGEYFSVKFFCCQRPNSGSSWRPYPFARYFMARQL
jgi:hypothetical protein